MDVQHYKMFNIIKYSNVLLVLERKIIKEAIENKVLIKGIFNFF